MEIDNNCFKAFKTAADTLNFTEAARLAHMTQSGVSHHIAKLERSLGLSLFLRVGKKVHLTHAGRELRVFIERYEDQVQVLHDSIHKEQASLQGLVRYSMPESCLLSPHFSMLLKEKAKSFSNVDLKMNLKHSEEVVAEVFSHDVDFGFVTQIFSNPDLNFEPFCKEEYVMVVPTSSAKKDILKSSWIQYPGFDDIAGKWRAHQAKLDSKLFQRLTGQTNSLRAALTMVAHGLGVTISPRHCLDEIAERKNLTIAEGFKTSVNQIYIVTLKNQFLPERVQRTIEVFRRMK